MSNKVHFIIATNAHGKKIAINPAQITKIIDDNQTLTVYTTDGIQTIIHNITFVQFLTEIQRVTEQA